MTSTTTAPDDQAPQRAWWSDEYLDLVNDLHDQYPDASRPVRQRMLQALHDLLSGVAPNLGDVDAWVVADDDPTAGES